MSKNIMNKEEEYKTAMVQQAPENQEQPPVDAANVEPKEEFDLARTVGKVVLVTLGIVVLGVVGICVAGAVSKKKDEDEPEVIDDDAEDEEEKDTDSDDIANKVVELLEANGVEFKEKTEF